MNFLYELNSTTSFLKLIHTELEVGWGEGITGAEAILPRDPSPENGNLGIVACPVIFAGTNKVAYWLSYAYGEEEAANEDEVLAELKKRAAALVFIHNAGIRALTPHAFTGIEQLG